MNSPMSAGGRPSEGHDTSDPLWRLEESLLKRGLRWHALLFVFVIGILFVLNRAMRGDNGAWWVIDLVQIWSVAWGLHIYGVALAYSSRRPPTAHPSA